MKFRHKSFFQPCCQLCCFVFKEPTGNAVEVTCLNCGKEVAVTQWDVHDSLCQGGSSDQQSTCTDHLDLTTENDNAVEINASTKSENSRIENSSPLSLTDDASTKVPRSCHGDLQSKDCSDAGFSENGKCVPDEGRFIEASIRTTNNEV